MNSQHIFNATLHLTFLLNGQETDNDKSRQPGPGGMSSSLQRLACAYLVQVSDNFLFIY